MGSFTPNDNPFAGMRNTIKHRVSYFYDSDVGDFAYEPGHPMKVNLFPYQIAVSCLGAQRPRASLELERAVVSKARLLGSSAPSCIFGNSHTNSMIMKPHRIRLTHALVVSYGLYKRMEIFVGSLP
jgi:hypothetical protein